MRWSQSSSASYTIGPGPLTPAVRTLLAINVAGFVVGWLMPVVQTYAGLLPVAVVANWWWWQPLTYMFLHGGVFHLIFNMLALWMFGVELERIWGSRFFTTYYLVCGVGAALTTIALAFSPLPFAEPLITSVTVGASGAIYGLLLAYAMYFPTRPIYLYMLFPIPARVFVIIIGLISLYSSMQSSQGGIAHITHLGGLIAGYVFLKCGRGGIVGSLRFRFDQWRRGTRRRRFDVVEGGRRGPDRWVH